MSPAHLRYKERSKSLGLEGGATRSDALGAWGRRETARTEGSSLIPQFLWNTMRTAFLSLAQRKLHGDSSTKDRKGWGGARCCVRGGGERAAVWQAAPRPPRPRTAPHSRDAVSSYREEPTIRLHSQVRRSERLTTGQRWHAVTKFLTGFGAII